MYKSMLAGAAMVAVAAVAAPIVGWSAEVGTQTAQAEPGSPGWWHHRNERQGGRDHGRESRDQSPAQRCEDRLARQAGVVAYVVAKLNLTDQQKPLWSQVQTALQTAADKQRALCATLKPRDQRASQTLLDRLDQRQQMLQARLEAMQQVRPALNALYQALTPDQRAIVDHPFRRL
jgi:flagellar capping protein FliD